MNGFCRSAERQSEDKRKRENTQIFGSCQWTKKAMEYKGDADTFGNLCNWKTLQELVWKTHKE